MKGPLDICGRKETEDGGLVTAEEKSKEIFVSDIIKDCKRCFDVMSNQPDGSLSWSLLLLGNG